MRKFLVKHFVLDYFFTVFNTEFRAVRASRISFPLLVISGIFGIFDSVLYIPTLVLFFLSVWFGFPLYGLGYFKLFPAKWNELDTMQKWQYGKHNIEKLTAEEFKEWAKINEKINV